MPLSGRFRPRCGELQHDGEAISTVIRQLRRESYSLHTESLWMSWTDNRSADKTSGRAKGPPISSTPCASANGRTQRWI
jgi:hypothetical protein